MKKAKFNSKKNVLYLGLVSMFTDISTEMIFPILPIFLSNVLGLSMAFIGLIDGLSDSIASILKVFSGFASDKLRKRKAVTLFGYGLSALSKPFYVLAFSGIQVLLIKFIDRIGKGIREAPRDALIVESVSKKNIGKSFGFQKALDFSGSVIGALLAFILLQFVTKDYRTIFMLAVVPIFLGVLVLNFFVRDSKIKLIHGHVSKISFKIFGRDFKLFVLISTIFNLANFTYAFFILRSQQVGIPIAFAPIVYLVYGASATIASYFMGKVADKVDKDKIIALGYLLFAASNFGMIFANSAWIVWGLILLYGLQAGLINSVSRAFIGELIPKEFKATAFGTYYTATGLALLPAGIIAGTLWDKFSFSATFLFGTGIGIFAALLMLIFVFKIHNHVGKVLFFEQ